MKGRSSTISFSHLKSVSRGSRGGAVGGGTVAKGIAVRVRVRCQKIPKAVITMWTKVKIMRTRVSVPTSRLRVKAGERSGGIVVYRRVDCGGFWRRGDVSHSSESRLFINFNLQCSTVDVMQPLRCPQDDR